MEEKNSPEVLINHYKNASEEEKKQIETIACEAYKGANGRTGKVSRFVVR